MVKKIQKMKTKTVKYRACKDLHELGRIVVTYPDIERWDSFSDTAKDIVECCKCLHLRVPAMPDTELFFRIENVIMQKDTACVCLNEKMYSLQELFNTFEIEVNGEWLPFGVIQK